MTADLVVRYMHFIAIFVVFSLLTIEHLLLKDEVEAKWFKKIVVVDLAYSISLIVTLICGLGLWLWVGKPAGFYADNWVFHAKVSLFALVCLCSFIPTAFIFRNRKKVPQAVHVPKLIVWVIRGELLLLVCIPFLAVLMANGVGYIH